MNLQRTACVAVIAISFLSACSKHDEERADQAEDKTRTEMHRLGTEAKQDAQRLNQELSRGLNGTPNPSVDEASRKLDKAGRIAQTEVAQAGQKIDQAAFVARIKAKLASDVGLASVSTIQVDAATSDVILRGTVSSAEQKRAAETTVLQVDGVSHVRNELIVQP